MKGTWEATDAGWDWRWAAAVGGIAVIGVSGGASGVFSGLETLLWWVAGVFGATATVVTALVIRAMRRRTGDYVRSIHGPTVRDQEIDENQRLRREIQQTRATRLAIERQKLIEAAMTEYSVPPGTETAFLERLPADYTQRGTITGRIIRDEP